MAALHSVGDALLQLLNEVLLFLPRLLSALIILLVGYIVARVVRALLTRGLRLLKFDQVADRAGITGALQRAGTRLDAAAVLAAIVFWWIFLTFIEMAVNALGLPTITAFLNGVLAYLPSVFAALVIVIVGALVASVVAGIVRGAAGGAGLATAGFLAEVARWALLLFAILAALTQLHVAESMIFILFAAIVGMAALAGGLAFGLGGVEGARGLLAGWSMGAMLQPGQRVQIGQQMGTVVRHDLNTTVLDTGTGGKISIPNAALASERVTLVDGTVPASDAAAAQRAGRA